MINTDRKIFLCRPDKSVVTILNGVHLDSVSYTEYIKDYHVLTFTVDRYVPETSLYSPTLSQTLVESNGYEYLKVSMLILLEGIGYFQIQEPATSFDGYQETKEITAYATYKELEDKDLVGFAVNTGEAGSLERYEENLDDLGFAKEYITFYNESNHKLSLMHLVMEKLPGWSIGYIDPFIGYNEDTKLVSRFSFDVESENIYAFLTSTVAPRVYCVFEFDHMNYKINAYSTINYGQYTNIFLGLRNLINTVDISVQEDSVYTRFNVSGADDLSIRNWNYNDPRIINLDYFMQQPYVSDDLSGKIQAWLAYRDEHREEFADLNKQLAEITEKITEIEYRVPNDGDDYKQWDEMELDLLEQNLAYYNALLTSLQVSVDSNPQYKTVSGEQVYIPWTKANGDIDHQKYLDLLYEKANGYGGYYTYIEVLNYIIPNIEIAIENYQVPTDDKKDYVKDYETNWDLYGTIELKSILSKYEEQLASIAAFSKEWINLTDEEKATHSAGEAAYNLTHSTYVEITGYIGDESTPDTLKYKLKQLQNEITKLEAAQEPINEKRLTLIDNASDANENWFSEDDRAVLYRLFRDTDYVNENILTTSVDTTLTTIDVEKTLYDDAVKALSEVAQPQYEFQIDTDNLFALKEFEHWTGDFLIGNYIWVGTRDDYAVKLRIVSRSWNPCDVTPDLTVEFSNMVTSASGRNDLTYLLGEGTSSGKNSISSGTGSSSDEKEYMTAMLQLMKSSQLFSNIVGGAVSSSIINSSNGYIGALVSEYIKASEIQVEKLVGDEATFNAIFGKYADIEYLSSYFATIAQLETVSTRTNLLEADYADINTLLNGNLTSSNIHSMIISADKFTVVDGFIKNAMIDSLAFNKITGVDIDTTSITVHSNDGKSWWKDNTIQISDGNHVRVQMGKDGSDDYTLAVWDKEGKLIWDALGATEDTIQRKIIRDEIVADDANIQGSKLNIKSVVGEINNGTSKIKTTTILLDESNQTLDVAFNEMINSVGDAQATADEALSTTQTNTTSINVMQGQISAKIWNTDISTAITGLADTYVTQTEFDSLSVGGRNYLLLTSIDQTITGNNTTNQCLYQYSLSCGTLADLGVAEGDYVAISFNWEATGSGFAGNFIAQFNAIPWSISNGLESFAFTGTNVESNGSTTISSTNTSGRITMVGKVASDSTWLTSTATKLGFRLDNVPSTVKLTISNIQLEKGNKVTDWSSAPEDIAAEVTTISDKYVTMDATITGLSATVGNHTSQIANKADGSTVTDIQTQVTDLSISYEGFKGTVSSTYVTKTEFDALSIGGRNLLIGSVAYTKASPYKLTGTKDDTYVHLANLYCDLEAGVEYTVSAKTDGVWSNHAIGSGGNKCSLWLINAGAVLNHCITTAGKTSWSFTPTKTLRYNIRLNVYTSGDIVNFWDMQVEKGNIATDWSPAPEDNISAITTISDKVADYKLTLDEFSASVAETYSTKTELAEELTNINSSILTLQEWKSEASLKLTKDGITSIVGNYYAYKTDLDSAVNKIAETEAIATQTADKFNWIVKAGTSSSDFTITDRLISLTSSALNIDALVTFKNSATSGSSAVINGGSIIANTITVDKLIVGLNPNLMPSGLDTFEQYSEVPYWLRTSHDGSGISMSDTRYYTGTRSIKLTSATTIYLGKSIEEAVIPITTGQYYRISCYVYSEADLSLSFYTNEHSSTITSYSTSFYSAKVYAKKWQRLSFSYCTNNSQYAYLSIGIGLDTSGVTAYVDAFQVEEVENSTQEAGAFKPAGTTIIDGNNITTGVVKDANGNFTIDLNQGIITAKKLVVNSTNFQLSENGTMTAVNGIFKGTVTATSGTIGGFTIGDSAIYSGTAGSSGSVYLGTDKISLGSDFSVTSAGVLTARSGTIGGFMITDTDIAQNISATHTVNGTTYQTVLQAYYTPNSLNRWTTFYIRTRPEGSTTWDSVRPVEIYSDGEFKATNATIKGDIIADNIKAKNKFNISYNSLGTESVSAVAQISDRTTQGEIVLLELGDSTIGNTRISAYNNIELEGARTITYTPIVSYSTISENGTLLSSKYAASSHTHAYAASSHTHAKVVNDTTNIGIYTDTMRFRINTDNDELYGLGGPSSKWKQVYAKSATISTSDENEKNIIGTLDERYEKAFMELSPIIYEWKNFTDDDNHDRRHCGFGAQTVEKTLVKNGISVQEFGALCKDVLDVPTKDGRIVSYALRYEEFIPICVHMIQKTIKEKNELEVSYKELNERLVTLEDMFLELKKNI